MHKVIIEAPGEADLLKVSEKLKEGGVDYKLWVEQPENFPTCLAVKPYPKQVRFCNIRVCFILMFRRCRNISRSTSCTRDQSLLEKRRKSEFN